MCDATHSYVCRDSFMCVTKKIDAAANSAIEWRRRVDESYLKSRIRVCDVTDLCV